MAIHRASDDTPDITTYCTVQDVLDEAIGIDPDDNHNDLSRLMQGGRGIQGRDAFIRRRFAETFRLINRWSRRDFGLHEDVDVVLDGDATNVIMWMEYGFYPLREVNSIALDGVDYDADAYENYLGEESVTMEADLIAWDPPSVRRTYSSGLFPAGVQNISANISWGFETPPEDIVAAQAMLVLSRVLFRYPAIQDPRDPNMPAGVRIVAQGDFRVNTGSKPQYWDQAQQLENEAKAICFTYQRARVYVASGSVLD